MKRWFQRLKIAHKMAFFAVIILIPSVIFLLQVYDYWSDFVFQESIRNYELIYDQQIKSIEDNMKQRQLIVRTICENSSVQKMVASEDPEEVEELYSSKVRPVLEALTETALNGQMIWLIQYNNMSVEEIHRDYEGLLSKVKSNDYSVKEGIRDYSVFNISHISNQSWFHRLKGNLQEYKIQRTNMDYINRCLSMVAEIKYKGEVKGMLRLIFPITDFIGKEQPEFRDGEILTFVLDEDYYLLSAEQWKRKFVADNWDVFDEVKGVLRNGETYQKLNDKYIITAEKMGNTDFSLVVLSPIDRIREKNQQLRNILTICILFIFLLLVIFVAGMSRYIARRLFRLREGMRHFEKGELDTQLAVYDKDEISEVYSGFNRMTHRIKNLMQMNVEMAREKEKMELQLLQQQINPHFLYNSLSVILRLAEIGSTHLIKDMVLALTEFYRLSLNKGHSVYSVKHEKQQLEAYIKIHSIRKGGSFSCNFDFDESYYDCRIPKLILQPFVENIFEHAYDEEHLYININIRLRGEDDMLYFTVEDDGCGMDMFYLQEELEDKRSNESRRGYGIRNVVDRLHLIYGEDCIFEIMSEEGVGTCVHIKLPKNGNL